MYRLCWSKFSDTQTPVVSQYYQLFQVAASSNGSDVPITRQVNVNLSAYSAVASGLQLQVTHVLTHVLSRKLMPAVHSP